MMQADDQIHLNGLTFPLDKCALQVHLHQDEAEDHPRVQVYMLGKHDGEWAMTVVGREKEDVYESFGKVKTTLIHSLLRACASHINAAADAEKAPADLPVILGVSLGYGAIMVSCMGSAMSRKKLGKQETVILSKLNKLISSAGISRLAEDVQDKSGSAP